MGGPAGEREERLDLPADRYWDPALSPNGRSLAISIASSNDAGDLHVLDLIRGTKLPLTSGGGADFSPVWTPDGREIIYAAESPVFNLFRRPADASRPSSSLFQDRADQYPGSFTPDGDTLLFEHDVSPYYALEKIPLSGGEPQPVYAPDFSLNMPLLSPNGRWLAYTSEEAGRDQLFLSPYADPTASRRQVSVNGGEEPRWTRNGRELVFRWGAAMLAVSVDPETGELGRPQTLFEGAYESSPDGTSRNYDVTADGERFLMVKRPPDRAPRQIVVVTNFFDRLRALDSGDSGRGGR